MANIKNLEMAAALSNSKYVSIKKSLFGLLTKAVYAPTQSALTVKTQEYSPEEGERLGRLLTQPLAQIVKALQDGQTFTTVPIGNVRLEGCLSADGQFVALQLFRFIDFGYKPLCEPFFVEGSDAQVLARLFA